ncbi:MAG: nuclear transport factor 2 family protein [Telluria sp.]|nr:nuclear transport factor 2 family protein [Telluria sp.]
MKHILLACCALLLSLGAPARTVDADAALKQQVNAFVDEWHDDAAHARLAYFDKIAKDGVYIGTDKTELWHRDQFKQWARRFFERKSAWAFKATRRNVYLSPDRQFIWFDELLDTQMGVCQASGVIRKSAKGFEIAHYQLSIAVPNGVASKVSAAIKEFDAAPAAK